MGSKETVTVWTRSSALSLSQPGAETATEVVPGVTPVRVAFAAVAPAGTRISGVTVASAGLPVERLTVRPPAGAGAVRMMGTEALRPGPTRRAAGSRSARWRTVTRAVSGWWSGADAVRVVWPRARPVTTAGAGKERAPSGMVTAAGVTDAMPVGEVASETVTPPGPAGAESWTETVAV
ncbi:MAG: hypothetical protein R3F39_09125 [Myxococcota bacterium]